ncbi:MAG: hypothetical protein Q4B42_03320 [Oscillospiraceae bacterium]|nr:hypothetical protein [Oscillospiraceae bacterium]
MSGLKRLFCGRKFYIVLAAQLLIAAVFVFSIILSPREAVELAPEQMGFYAGTLTEEGRYIDDTYGYQGYFTSAPTMELPRGSYTLSIDVSNTADHLNMLEIKSGEGVLADRLVYIPVCDGEFETNIWVLSSSASVSISTYYQYGALSVGELGVKENGRLTLAALTLFVFVCALADTVFYLFKYGRLKNDRTGRFILLSLLALVLLACLPLLPDGLREGHDLEGHLMRLEGVADALRHGQIPARVYPFAVEGYGYASGLFYPDLFLYPAALLRLLGFPITFCYKALVLTINTLCVLSAYFGYKAIFKRRFTALASAALSAFASYRLINLWLRSAVGEALAMGFFPLITASLWLILRGQGDSASLKKGVLYGVLGFSGIIQSHVLSYVMMGAYALVFLLLSIKRVFEKDRFRALLKLALTTLALNLWFLLPFCLLVGGDYRVNSSETPLFTYSVPQAALYPSQLFELDGRCAGLGQELSAGIEGEMTYGLGLLILSAAAVFVFSFIRRGAVKNRYIKAGLIALAGAAVCLFATTCFFPWDALCSLPLIGRVAMTLQFPWRLLSVATPLLVFAGCAGLNELEGRSALMACGLLALAACVQCAFFFSTYGPDFYVYDTPGLHSSSVGNGEYLPAGTKMSLLNKAYPESETVQVLSYEKEGLKVEMRLANASSGEAELTVPLLYYPGYSARAAESGEALELFSGENGTLTLRLPAGFEGEVEIDFVGETIWHMADAFSLLTLLFLTVRGFKRKQMAALAR